ncbi:unnamed protein product [Moneuplotes crassus]|uniref:Steroid 5-alpha reductase C-terminal domain-containing protein n=1 Tax=Euplotes crassus TaxID=5936 RepID=A0AAD1XQN5_EUPCR|nr:unnamed protein product [Moneuplotes crassus]
MMRDAEPEDFWSPVVIIFGIQVICYIAALIMKDNSIVDIFWGLIVSCSMTIILVLNNNWHHRTIVTLILIWLWGIRMAVYVVLKHNGEDWRFADMREKFRRAGGKALEIILSGVLFFMTGLTMLLISSSAHFIAIYSHENDDLFVLEWIGWVIIFVCIILEFVSDIQLLVFKKKKDNKGKLCMTGLWRWSRHPNFFFEAVVWWGFYITACSIKWGYITIWAPVVITLTLRYVSGVPLIEEKYKDREDFEQYKKQTNCFIPWFPKSASQVTQRIIVENPEKERRRNLP